MCRHYAQTTHARTRIHTLCLSLTLLLRVSSSRVNRLNSRRHCNIVHIITRMNNPEKCAPPRINFSGAPSSRRLSHQERPRAEGSYTREYASLILATRAAISKGMNARVQMHIAFYKKCVYLSARGGGCCASIVVAAPAARETVSGRLRRRRRLF